MFYLLLFSVVQKLDGENLGKFLYLSLVYQPKYSCFMCKKVQNTKTYITIKPFRITLFRKYFAIIVYFRHSIYWWGDSSSFRWIFYWVNQSRARSISCQSKKIYRYGKLYAMCGPNIRWGILFHLIFIHIFYIGFMYTVFIHIVVIWYHYIMTITSYSYR